MTRAYDLTANEWLEKIHEQLVKLNAKPSQPTRPTLWQRIRGTKSTEEKDSPS